MPDLFKLSDSTAQLIDAVRRDKYMQANETDWPSSLQRVSLHLFRDNKTHAMHLYNSMHNKQACPAGRVMAGAGTNKNVTYTNCFVAPLLQDSMKTDPNQPGLGIMDCLSHVAYSMQMGGGVGTDFSPLRPEGALVKRVQAEASGPISFMHMWDSMCRTIMSAGDRRGAMMATLRVDHPDVLKFITAKQTPGALTMFNMSVLITDAFMGAVEKDELWALGHWEPPFDKSKIVRVERRYSKSDDHNKDWFVYQELPARKLWGMIMENTYTYAEPGAIFIDTYNKMNNLHYCEYIQCTNPSMPAGTLVHTNIGITPIEYLEGKKFKVKSLDGKWVEAECFLSSSAAKIVEIDFGSLRTVKCTPEHKWPVLLNGRYIRVRADELVSGDLVPANRNEFLGSENVRPDLIYEDGLMAGIVFGNGTYNERSDNERAYLSISFNRVDKDLQKICAQYFDANVRMYDDEAVVSINRNEQVREFCQKVGLSLGDKSKLPDTVWKSNDDFISGFINGLFSTDGSISDNMIVFTNKSFEVVREVGVLLAFHGVLSILSKGRTILRGKVYGRADLRITKNGAKRFATLFELTSQRKQKRLEKLAALEVRHHVNSDHLEIKSVSSVDGGKVPVWDISVYHDQHVFPTEWGFTGNCGEQGLPPDQNCNLSHLNLSRLTDALHSTIFTRDCGFDFIAIDKTARLLTRMSENVIDLTPWPTDRQRVEAFNKRRIGIGFTGLANALMFRALPYGSSEARNAAAAAMEAIRNACYRESVELAREKGPFPLFDRGKYLAGEYIKTLPEDIREGIAQYGIRNALLNTIAPTGTISIASADNASGGIEPVFSPVYMRKVLQADNSFKSYRAEDFGFRVYANAKYDGDFDRMMADKKNWPGFMVTTNDLKPKDHLRMQAVVQTYVDSSISKTINCPTELPFDEFSDIYKQAYDLGCKGCTTYRPAPESGRGAVLTDITTETHGSVELDEDAAKLVALGADPGPVFIGSNVSLPSRPRTLPGNTHKIEWGEDAAIYVTFNHRIDENGRKVPHEMFINTKSAQHHAYQQALTRMISAVFRKGGDVRFVAKELSEIHSMEGQFVDGKYVSSVIALIGIRMMEEFRYIGYTEQDEWLHVGEISSEITNSVPEGMNRGGECPKCHQLTLIRQEGCWMCTNCTYNKCG